MLNELAGVHEKLGEYKNATPVYRKVEKLLAAPVLGDGFGVGTNSSSKDA